MTKCTFICFSQETGIFTVNCSVYFKCVAVGASAPVVSQIFEYFSFFWYAWPQDTTKHSNSIL